MYVYNQLQNDVGVYGDFVLIDCRPATAFLQGHIKTAVHVCRDDLCECSGEHRPNR